MSTCPVASGTSHIQSSKRSRRRSSSSRRPLTPTIVAGGGSTEGKECWAWLSSGGRLRGRLTVRGQPVKAVEDVQPTRSQPKLRMLGEPTSEGTVTAEGAATSGDAELSGLLVCDGEERHRPGVLVVHGGAGLDDHAKSRARQLARLGLLVFVCDMYGSAIIGDRQRVLTCLRELVADHAKMPRRVQAGLDEEHQGQGARLPRRSGSARPHHTKHLALSS